MVLSALTGAALSHVRFGAVTPQHPTQKASSPITGLTAPSDVFFASSIKFGKWAPIANSTGGSLTDFSLIANPLNSNQFLAVINNKPVGTVTRNQKIQDSDKVAVEFFRTKDGYSVATTAKGANDQEVRFVNAAGSTLSVNGVSIDLFPMGTQPEALVSESQAAANAALNVQTPATQTIVTKAYIPIVGVGDRLERILKQVGGSYKPELELVPGESIINKLIGHYAESGIKEFFIPVTDTRLEFVHKAWREFKAAHPELANVTVNFVPQEPRIINGKPDYKTGTAGPLVQMIKSGLVNPNEPLFVAMGDHAVQPTLDIATLINTYDKNKLDGALLGVDVPFDLYGRYGMFEMAKDGEIKRFIEKPKGQAADELAKSRASANTAIFVLGSKGLKQLVDIKDQIDKGIIKSVDNGIDFSTHLWQPNAEKASDDPSKLSVHGMGQPVERWVDIGNVLTFMETVRRIANGKLYGPSETAKTRASIDEKTGAIYYQGCKEAAQQAGITFTAQGNTMIIAK